MRYFQPSTKKTIAVETERPFWTLRQLNRNLAPKDYWTFKEYGFYEVSRYISVQGPSDGENIWVDDYVKYKRTVL